nr:MAG TPA: hypothetical protein [Caudoviricetes sp.]
MLLYFLTLHSLKSSFNTSIVHTYSKSKFYHKNRPNTSTLPIYH